MPEQLRKWSLTSGKVIKHMHYGLRVQVPSGEIGVVDRVDIADGYIGPADWPTVGSVLTVVSGGYAGRQLRLSTRPSHLEEARFRATRDQLAANEAEAGTRNS
ncbi:S1 domain-containing protein [Streptomyces sp. SD15]